MPIIYTHHEGCPFPPECLIHVLKHKLLKLVYLAKQHQISNKYDGAPTARKIIGWVDDSRDHCALKIKNRGGQALTSALAFQASKETKQRLQNACFSQ